MDIKLAIGNRIKGNLPYPPNSTDLIIYNFLCEENVDSVHEDGWILDLHTGEYKFPMEKLTKSKFFWYGTKLNGETNEIEGTNICWRISDGMFVFWLIE